MKLADNRSGSYKIHAVTISNFLVYRFYGNIDYSKTHSTNWLKSFSKIWCNFHIDQNKGRSIKPLLKMQAMAWSRKKLYRTTLNRIFCLHCTIDVDKSNLGDSLDTLVIQRRLLLYWHCCEIYPPVLSL